MVFQTFLFLAILCASDAFVLPRAGGIKQVPRHMSTAQTEEASAEVQFTPVFDFSNDETVNSFDRIDDAIMGGISTSSIRTVPGEAYASWSGVCRVQGGGFCGTRTMPFQEPLAVGDAKGLYLDCRFSSDDEPERRVFKISTRTERSRGEELYQSEFMVPAGQEWTRIQIPFDDFQKVKMSTFVPDAEKMDVSEGIFQIGLTLSKFMLSQNMKELETFRPGYFELQVKSIGVYNTKEEAMSTPETMSETEMKKNRPLIVKVILPLTKLFFSEQANRRKAAMQILREKRGLSRGSAIHYGIVVRSMKSGQFMSTMQAVAIVAIDSFRSVSGGLLKYGLLKPLKLVSSLKKRLTKKPETQTTSSSLS